MENREQMLSEAEKQLAPQFEKIDRIAAQNTARVLSAFREARVSASMFGSTDGYGYDDYG